MAIEILTFGCRLNTIESEAMKARAAEAGLVDAVLVNTCAVTAEAVRQARQAIRKARAARPDAAIVVSGCAAQVEPKSFAAMPEVDRVLGNEDKLAAASYARAAPSPAAFGIGAFGIGASEKIVVNDIMSVRQTAGHLLEGLDGRARAFVQVQNGCDHRCTFCVIPYGRGNSRSVPMGVVVEHARVLAANGHAEIVLCGVDITSWGADLPGAPRLGALVRAILRHVPELARLRLSSIDMVEIDPALLRCIAEEERLMPHFHLSLQSGDDMILKRMKRRHFRADAVRLCGEIRRLRPEAAFGADLIAGFPTETDAMAANSLSLIEDCGLDRVHVFPYSPRPLTPAARMPPLPPGLVKARAAALRAAGAAAWNRHLAREVGRRRSVLIEMNGLGRTEQFTPVAEFGGAPGTIVPVRIVGAEGGRLVAEAA